MVVKEPLVILLPWTVSWVAKISLSYTHTHIHIYVHTWYVVGSIIRCSRRFLATKDWLIYSFFLKFEDNFLDVKKKIQNMQAVNVSSCMEEDGDAKWGE